jgi:glyoxylase-like metal-dependent hydrolase (beta-lactamase superfamily II)
MIEKISPNIFKIVVPLPMEAVSSMNSYVIIDPDRNLIVDPGMAHTLCHDAMKAAVKELGLDLRRTDFFITHHHIDHFGLVPQLMVKESIIYINHTEAALIHEIASGEAATDLTHLFEVLGFVEEDLTNVVSFMMGDEYRTKAPRSFGHVGEGDKIKKGGYCLNCVVAPGHSMAHTCLYEPDHKIMFSGDAISPVIPFVSDRGNPLGDHLKSLNQLYEMDIDLVLPGHGSSFRDFRERIDTLKTHHEKRLETVLEALTDVGQNAYHIASMIWECAVDDENWDTLNVFHKFLFVRDCFAHLKYLYQEDRIDQAMSGRQLVYKKKI